ncbi:MAG: hypothetical protein WDM78_19850 [Puia sp.]
MRKLIISMNLSLDGYLSGPCGELDWHFEIWNDGMCEEILKQLQEQIRLYWDGLLMRPWRNIGR